MKASMFQRGPTLPALTGALTLLSSCAGLFLTGCQGKSTVSGGTTAAPPVIARVAGDPITQEEYYPRVERIIPTQIPQGLDAGGAALVGLISEKLVAKLAQEKKVVPSEQDVTQFANFYRKRYPQVESDIKAGKLTQDELVKRMRLQLMQFNIGTDGDKPKPEDVTKAYNDHKNDLFTLSSYTFRAIQAPTETLAKKALAKLKSTKDFKAAAQALGAPPQVIEQVIQPVTKTRDELLGQLGQPSLVAALDSLKPNDISNAPVPITNVQTGQTSYALIQLISRSDTVFKQDEVSGFLQQVALQTTHPQAGQHAQQELATYTNKAISKFI